MGAASRADFTDDRQYNVFRGDPRLQRPIHTHQHVFHSFLQQTLGRHYVLNLRRANPLR